MTRSHFVKKARKDYPEAGIKRGDSYFWWKFNFLKAIHKSRTAPTRSQLTQSGFLQDVYAIEDRISSLSTDDDLSSETESIKDDLQNLADECQEKLDNMPEQLQENSTSGQLLQERVDEIDSMISELDGVDAETDEEGIRSDVTRDFISDRNMRATIQVTEADGLPKDEKEALDQQIKEKTDKRKNEILDEIQGVSYNGS